MMPFSKCATQVYRGVGKLFRFVRTCSCPTRTLHVEHIPQPVPIPSEKDAKTCINASCVIRAKIQELRNTDPAPSSLPVALTIPEAPRLTGVERKASSIVKIKWRGGDELEFPISWLRDNCQCEMCFHPTVKSRRLSMKNINLDALTLKTQVTNDGCILEVTWDDGHVSKYEASWLWQRRFTWEGRQARRQYASRNVTLWGADFAKRIPMFPFEKVMSEDHTMHDWLCAMEEFGFTKLLNAPKRPGQLRALTEHISFHRTTHYGHLFRVQAKSDPNNIAFTSDSLGLHTDIAYDNYPPGVQFLHYIQQPQTDTGMSEFADGFNAATQMCQEDPDAFKTLVDTPVDFIDIGTDAFGRFHRIDSHHTFKLDTDGELNQIVYSNQCRDSHTRTSPENTIRFLRALQKFDKILYRKDNLMYLKPVEGEICAFANNRVLHGRTGFSSTPRDRFLEGMYMDTDELTSKRRVLAEKLGIFSSTRNLF